MAPKMKHAKGGRLNIRFSRKIKLEFQGARLTSDGGLLTYSTVTEFLFLNEKKIPDGHKNVYWIDAKIIQELIPQIEEYGFI